MSQDLELTQTYKSAESLPESLRADFPLGAYSAWVEDQCVVVLNVAPDEAKVLMQMSEEQEAAYVAKCEFWAAGRDQRELIRIFTADPKWKLTILKAIGKPPPKLSMLQKFRMKTGIMANEN